MNICEKQTKTYPENSLKIMMLISKKKWSLEKNLQLAINKTIATINNVKVIRK